MIFIKLIDYFATSADFPELCTKTPVINAVSNNTVQINNFTEINEYEENMISISTVNKQIVITGCNLNICYIAEKYIQINGKIKSISFEGND